MTWRSPVRGIDPQKPGEPTARRHPAGPEKPSFRRRPRARSRPTRGASRAATATGSDQLALRSLAARLRPRRFLPLRRAGSCRRRLGLIALPRPVAARVGLRHLRSEEEDLRGVVDPHHQDHDGSRRTVGRRRGRSGRGRGRSAALPTAKSAEVKAAPAHTSPQATSVSGRNLKISANSTVMIRKETAAFVSWAAAGGMPIQLKRPSAAAMAARHHERDQQQEADGQHHRERPEAAAQERLSAAALLAARPRRR